MAQSGFSASNGITGLSIFLHQGLPQLYLVSIIDLCWKRLLAGLSLGAWKVNPRGSNPRNGDSFSYQSWELVLFCCLTFFFSYLMESPKTRPLPSPQLAKALSFHLDGARISPFRFQSIPLSAYFGNHLSLSILSLSPGEGALEQADPIYSSQL